MREARATAPACRRRDGSTGVRWAVWSDAGAASFLVTARSVENRFQPWRVPDPPIGPSSIQADVIGTDGTRKERHDRGHEESLDRTCSAGQARCWSLPASVSDAWRLLLSAFNSPIATALMDQGKRLVRVLGEQRAASDERVPHVDGQQDHDDP